MATYKVGDKVIPVPDGTSKTDFYMFVATANQGELDYDLTHNIDLETVRRLRGVDRNQPPPTIDAYHAAFEDNLKKIKNGEVDEVSAIPPPPKIDDNASIRSNRSRDSESRKSSKKSEHKETPPKVDEKSSFPYYDKASRESKKEKDEISFRGRDEDEKSIKPIPPIEEPSDDEGSRISYDEQRERRADSPKGPSTPPPKEKTSYDYGFDEKDKFLEEEREPCQEEDRQEENESRIHEDEEIQEPRVMTDDEEQVERPRSRPPTSHALSYIEHVPMAEELTKNNKIREIVDCEVRLCMLNPDPEVRLNRFGELKSHSLRDISSYLSTLEDDIYVKNQVAKNRWFIRKGFTIVEKLDETINTRAFTGLCRDVEEAPKQWNFLDEPLEEIARTKRRGHMNPYLTISLELGKILGMKVLENKVFKGKKVALDFLGSGPPQSALDVPPPPPMRRPIDPPVHGRPSNQETKPVQSNQVVYTANTAPAEYQEPAQHISNRNIDPSRTQASQYNAPNAVYPTDMDPSGNYTVDEEYEQVTIPPL